MMRISDKGISFIKRHEGCRLTAYSCSAGVMTIGYGHTQGVHPGMAITQEEAESFLRRDVKVAETSINTAVTIPLRQCQFDALCSFVFNVGCGAFLRSTLIKKIKSNPSDPSIRDEFMRWVYAGKKELPGLRRRRKEEADMYFEP